MAKLIIKVPDKTAPGFLRRQKRASEFGAAVQSDKLDTQAWDKMVEFLLDFVTEPTDRDAARELLWDASEELIDAALATIRGDDAQTPLSSTPTSTTG